MNMRGLNFAILDNLSGMVVDFFNIDTWESKDFKMKRSKELYEKVRRMESNFLVYWLYDLQ